MDIPRIQELMALIDGTDFTEIEIRDGDQAVRLVRNPPGETPTPAAPRATVPEQRAEPEAAGGERLRAPLMGTFYRAPSPGAAPFVEPGDRVERETVVCIIESMKMMNQVEAETRGVIREVLVADGTPVETGQPLFVIEPEGA